MLEWLTATANWAGPIASILNFLIAAVGLPVGIVKGYKARRAIVAWFANILGNTQHASDRAMDAETAARGSTAASESAADNTRQVTALLEWAIPELMRRDAVIEEMKGRIDELLGTRARQVAAERPAATGSLLVPADAGHEHDPLTTTGRHRLHTTSTAVVHDPFAQQS